MSKHRAIRGLRVGVGWDVLWRVVYCLRGALAWRCNAAGLPAWVASHVSVSLREFRRRYHLDVYVVAEGQEHMASASCPVRAVGRLTDKEIRAVCLATERLLRRS